ncbi:hypothetical protein D3C87_1218070 [compost metagenome]
MASGARTRATRAVRPMPRMAEDSKEMNEKAVLLASDRALAIHGLLGGIRGGRGD